MRFVFSPRAPFMAALALLCMVLTVPCSHAAVRFSRPFAPQDGLVAPAEKPNRDGLCLNGMWQFQPVSLPADFHQGRGPAPALPKPIADGWDKTPIRIPSPWNANAFAFHDGLAGDFRCFPSYPESWNDVQMGWLRRNFTVPTAWKGRRLILHFDAVAGDTQVIVNGKTVGHHFDIFLPFDVDVTDAVKPGAKNELRVGVRKASLFDVQGKYGRRIYQGGSMWGQHIAGIWQDVTLEAVPVVHITDVFVKPLVSQDRLEADVTVRNDADHPVKVSLAGAASAWISEAGKDVLSAPEPRWRLAKTPALNTPVVSVTVPAHGSQTVTLSQKVAGRLKPWSPGSPNLYGLVCRINSKGGGVADAKYTRFGWRQITFQGAKVLLNGKPIIMKGDSWHFIGIPEMTRRYAWAWYKALKDAHLNAVRLHAEPYPVFFLDVADEQGILVLDETAMWASDGGPKLDDPAYWSNTEGHLQGLILRDRDHPSVFGWSVSNEIMPVIRNVFHGPQEMQDQLIRYDGLWAGICRKNDPTRVWISADGEDDAQGVLPTDVVHYGDASTFQRASALGKPWGVGEAGPAYYGSPEQIAQMAHDPRAYLSAFDRMEGVAKVSYDSLMDQRNNGADYRSVFNLVWYGLKPLPFGLSDTTRSPTLQDGVFFGKFVEGRPGVQPERLGPYAGTLNPGYDPSLPLYQTWPLFDAIKDAQSDPPVNYQPSHPFMVEADTARDPAIGDIPSVAVLSGAGGSLAQALATEGVTVTLAGTAAPTNHSLVMIDGEHPPGADAKPVIDATLAAGGTVVVWGVNPATLDQLNALLPDRLDLTSRTASSLVVPKSSPLTAGLTPASLYFSELNPSTVLPAGLGGPLVTDGTVLLAACDTDWRRWNGQAETDKTAMLLRSEREAKPSGAALVELSRGSGRLIVCGLPITAETTKAAALNRTLLGNLGIRLGDGTGSGSALSADGTITHALAWGWAGVASIADGLADSSIDPNSGPMIAAGVRNGRHSWRPVSADANGSLDLSSLRSQGEQATGVAYLSFRLFSPKALDNLLLDPHLPNVSLQVGPVAAAQIWLNAGSVQTQIKNKRVSAPTLLLQQGWNHVLVKVVRAPGADTSSPALHLESSQADYLTQLHAAQEKP